MIKEIVKKDIKKKIRKGLLFILSQLAIPILIIALIFILVSYIADIFYIGINNEEKSNMKNEIKYYTTSEYTKDDSKTFFESIGDFISGIFKTEIVENAKWPVVGKSSKDITSYYGYRKAPTSGASTFHSRNRYCSTRRNKISSNC